MSHIMTRSKTLAIITDSYSQSLQINSTNIENDIKLLNKRNIIGKPILKANHQIKIKK